MISEAPQRHSVTKNAIPDFLWNAILRCDSYGSANQVMGISFQMYAQRDNADKQRLQEIVKMEDERCHSMCSMTHLIKVDARIK
jgi:hypothetical protein